MIKELSFINKTNYKLITISKMVAKEHKNKFNIHSSNFFHCYYLIEKLAKVKCVH